MHVGADPHKPSANYSESNRNAHNANIKIL